MTYAAPLADMRLVLDAFGNLPDDAAEVADAVLGEAAKFAENELAPLNQPGDRIGSVLENGVVRTPPGFREAYRKFVEGGWNGLTCEPEIGGQGLPLGAGGAAHRDVELGLHGLGAVPATQQRRGRAAEDARLAGAEAALSRQAGLGRMARHDEPDRAAGRLRPRRAEEPARCRQATRAGASITGSPVRRSSSPTATTTSPTTSSTWCWRVCPTRRRAAAASRCSWCRNSSSTRTAVRASATMSARLRLEEKLGIHASPTCVLSYGEDGGAIGWRIGEPHRGLEAMFTMMNNERLLVGVQGVGDRRARLPDRARLCPARGCRASRSACRADGATPPIVHHPDVRRMLLVDARRDRGGARARLLRRRGDRRRAARSEARSAPRRPADPGGQGVVQRQGYRDRLDRHPGAWRHGLYRGDRRGPTSARRAHRRDLRGHQRHPGRRSGRPQARPRQGRGGARIVRRDRDRPRRSVAAIARRCASRSPTGSPRSRTRPPIWSTPTRRSPPPARRPISTCSAPCWAAHCWRGSRVEAQEARPPARRSQARHRDVLSPSTRLARAPGFLPAIKGGATVVGFDPDEL